MKRKRINGIKANGRPKLPECYGRDKSKEVKPSPDPTIDVVIGLDDYFDGSNDDPRISIGFIESPQVIRTSDGMIRVSPPAKIPETPQVRRYRPAGAPRRW